mmetsp:Transcript_8254/g.27451  ORF Transcript_8254/g.27451 Transcript_8254/m.27451 type:complete len:248 (-) Transcript_8254:903-1646(-)
MNACSARTNTLVRRSSASRASQSRSRASRAVAAAKGPEPAPAPATDEALGRRSTLAAAAVAPLLVLAPTARADGLKDFYGAANPPATYGGVGGTTKELAKYTFQIPASWKEAAVTKSEKGYTGIDSKFVSPSNSATKAFVVSLNRAGEDGRNFALTNAESTLASITGADIDFQDSVSLGEVLTTEKELDGKKSFEYEVEAPNHYYVRCLVKRGRFYAFFVTAPDELWAKDADTYRAIAESFVAFDVV